MGAVRIYKDVRNFPHPWLVRSNGCVGITAHQCDFGKDHDGYCNSYSTYERVLNALHFDRELRSYISK